MWYAGRLGKWETTTWFTMCEPHMGGSSLSNSASTSEIQTSTFLEVHFIHNLIVVDLLTCLYSISKSRREFKITIKLKNQDTVE